MWCLVEIVLSIVKKRKKNNQNMQNLHSLFIIQFVCLSLHATFCIACFDAAKFSIKLFSCIYFTVSNVRQRDEYEIMTAM